MPTQPGHGQRSPGRNAFAKKDPQKRDLSALDEIVLLRAVIDSLPTPVVYKDRQGRYLGCNRAFASLLGRPKEGLVGESVGDVLPKEIAETLSRLEREVLENRGAASCEIRLPAPDGTVRHLVVEKAVLAAGNGQVLGTVGIATDITERKRAEEALEAERSRFYSVLDDLPAMVSLRDRNLRIRYANRRFRELFGDPEGKCCYELMAGRTDPCEACQLLEVFEANSVRTWEYRNASKDKTFQVYGYPFVDADGARMVLALGIDITERKKAEEALELERSRFHTVLEELPGFVYVRGADFSIRYANRYFRETLGDPQGRRCYEVTTGRQRPCETCHAIDLGQDRKVRDWEFFYKPKGLTFQMHAYPFRDADGSEAVLVLGMDVTERKQAEERLRLSEERYHTLVKNANEGIFVVQDGLFKFGNRRSAEMAGYTRAELSGVSFMDLVHPEDRQTVVRKYLENLRPGAQPQHYLFRVLHKSGTVRWFEMKGTPILWEGKPAALCFISDVTERREAEERAFRQSALLEGINRVFREALSCETEDEVARRCLDVALELTQSEFGFLGDVDAEGKLTVIAMSDLGWEACRMPRTAAVNLLHDRKPRGIWGEVWRTSESVVSNDPARHPARVGPPPGHPELRAFLGVPMKERGRVVGMIGLANKASGYTAEDRQLVESLCVAFLEALRGKKAEVALRKHKDHLEAVVEVRTQELRTANEELRKGIEKQRLAEQEVRKLNEELEERVKQRTRDLEEAYERLKELDKMKDAFLSSVSHELRTPLTSIRSFSEILLNYGDLDPENSREFLGIINSEAERLTRLINDLLDLSRIEAGGMVWHDSLFSLDELIRDAAKAVGGLLEEKSLGLVLEIQPDLPPLFADRDRIQQILTNLLSNAVKFSWKGGEIRVRADSFEGRREGDPGRWIRVSVSDQGVGIDEKDQEIIFDKFRQGTHDSLGEKPKGTGLGLPICKEIVIHYGGKLMVESRKGEGSTFTFLLPAASPARTDSQSADTSAHPAS